MPKISSLEFTVLSKYLFDISGIALSPGKEYLLEHRLAPLLTEYQCVSFSELYYKAKRDSAIEEKIIDALTTNETYFFRDVLPFELLQHKIIPDLVDKRTRENPSLEKIPIRIWSAGCSTGQEVYSIAFVLKNLGVTPENYHLFLVGTDISNAAISKASYGRYTNFEVTRGLMPDQVSRYFTRINENAWQVADEYRWMVTFKTQNLFKPFERQSRFDIIFCRNVGIYFSSSDRRRLHERLLNALAPDGYLILGSTESIANDTDLFTPRKYLRTTFYQPKLPHG